MNVNVTGPFVYFTIPIFGGIPITQTTVSSFVVTLGLILTALWLGKDLNKRPHGKQVLVEKAVMLMHNMVVETMGPHNAHWTPFMITLFLSSICGSLIGMVGFLRSTTADLSTVMVWALMVSAVIIYHNIKNNGFLGWLKGYTAPVAAMTPINVISEIAQPISMAFRHFGNVAGGGVITGIVYTALSGLSVMLLNWIAESGWLVAAILLALGVSLFLLWRRRKKIAFLAIAIISALLGFFGLLQAWDILSGVPIFQLGIPAVLSVYFDLFAGFVQALVFSLLTMVYIAGACLEPKSA